jgi:hypothetical protein
MQGFSQQSFFTFLQHVKRSAHRNDPAFEFGFRVAAFLYKQKEHELETI